MNCFSVCTTLGGKMKPSRASSFCMCWASVAVGTSNRTELALAGAKSRAQFVEDCRRFA